MSSAMIVEWSALCFRSPFPIVAALWSFLGWKDGHVHVHCIKLVYGCHVLIIIVHIGGDFRSYTNGW